jgi:hypothetical protein
MERSRPEPFKGRHFEAEIILLCVRWHLRFGLSFRNLEEMMAELNVSVDHVTIRIYLPEADPREPGYDKGRIIDMILYHDIGEFRTGDVVAAEKNPMHDEAEEAAVQYLGACGTYLGVSNMVKVVDLHHDFERSDDINKRVAKDIDSLEYYVQLNRYRPLLSTPFCFD